MCVYLQVTKCHSNVKYNQLPVGDNEWNKNERGQEKKMTECENF